MNLSKTKLVGFEEINWENENAAFDHEQQASEEFSQLLDSTPGASAIKRR